MTATAAQLHDAVVATLKETGRYEKIKAGIRQELFNLLTGGDHPDSSSISKENFLINELIREYLQFNGYTNSLSVFMRETGHPEEPMNRDFLSQTLNIVPHRLIPILYSMTATTDEDEHVIHTKVDPDAVNLDSGSETASDEDDGFFEIKSHF